MQQLLTSIKLTHIEHNLDKMSARERECESESEREGGGGVGRERDTINDL